MIKTNLHNPQCAQTLENHCWGIPLPPAPHVPRRASRAKKTHLSVDLARDHFQTTPPTPVYQMKGPNGLCTGLYATCAQTPKALSSPRNDVPPAKERQAGQNCTLALWDATSRPLCGRPERATTGLNSQVCCGDGVGSARRAERPCASRVRNLQLYAYRPTCNSLMTFALLVRTPTCRGGAACLSRPR
jgi:hypothetical protein